MIKKLTKREQGIFLICLLLVSIFTVKNGVIEPLRKKSILTDKEIRTNLRLINKSTTAIQRSNELEWQYNAHIKRFKQYKSNEQVMASTLTEIEDVAREYDLQISDLKPNKVKNFEFYNKFSVSLTINSKLINILRFLHDLQDQPHYFNFEEVRFENSSRRNTSGIRTRLVLSKILIP